MREFQFSVAWRCVSDLGFWDEQLGLDIAMISLMNQKFLFFFIFGGYLLLQFKKRPRSENVRVLKTLGLSTTNIDPFSFSEL